MIEVALGCAVHPPEYGEKTFLGWVLELEKEKKIVGNFS